MSSRSNSSNQGKRTHLPLQKRVFNAPLAAVIAMGCVTGIAGGIAATSAHPMQVAYAASSTTQGVFTLDRAAAGMDRSAQAEVPSNTEPGFLFSDKDFATNQYPFTWYTFTNDGVLDQIIKPALELYYGSGCTIHTPDYENGIIPVEVNGKINKHTFASFFYKAVDLKLPDKSKIVRGKRAKDPDVLKQIKANIIAANPQLKIKEDELTLEKYVNPFDKTTNRVIAYRANKEKVDCNASNPQYTYTGGLISLSDVFKSTRAKHKQQLSLTTKELSDDKKIEVEDLAHPDKFTTEQLNAIKDALNKVNAKVDNKDAVSAVKYEESKLVAVLSDNTTKEELDAAKLTKNKVVVAPAHKLNMPEKKVTVKDYITIDDTEKNIIKQALIKVNSSWLTPEDITFDSNNEITVKLGSNKSQPVKLTDLCDMVLALTLPEKKVEISSLDAPSQDDQQKIIDALIKANEQGANSINEKNITFNGKDIYVAKQTEDLAGNKGWARKTLTISDVAVLKSVEPLTLTTTELVDAQKVEVADPAKPEDFTDTQLSAIKDALNKVNAKVGDKDAVSDVYYDDDEGKLFAVFSVNDTAIPLDAFKLTKKKKAVAPAHKFNMPEKKIIIDNYEMITGTEKDLIQKALIGVNSWLTAENIKIDINGTITVTLDEDNTKTIGVADICDMKLKLKLPDPKVEISNLDAPTQDDQQKIIDALVNANQQPKPALTKDNIHFSGKTIEVAKAGNHFGDPMGTARTTLAISDVAVLKSVAPLTLATKELTDDKKVEVEDPAHPDKFTQDQLNAIKNALNSVNDKVGGNDAVSAVKCEASKLVAVLSDGTTKEDLDAAKLTKKKIVLKEFGLVAPSPVEVADPAQIQPDEVTKIVAAIKTANSSLSLQDSEITVDTAAGKVTVKRQGYKDETLEVSKIVTKKEVVTPEHSLKLPEKKSMIDDYTLIYDKEKRIIKQALISANPWLTEDKIDIDMSGKITVTLDDDNDPKIFGVAEICDMKLNLTLPEPKVEISSLDAPTQDDQQIIIDALVNANQNTMSKITKDDISFNGTSIKVAKQAEDYTRHKGCARATLTISDVAVLKIVLKEFGLVAPSPVEVADPAQIQEGEVTKIVAAIKAANPSLGLQDSEITVDKTSGAVTVKRQGYKDETLAADKVVTKKIVLKEFGLVAPSPVEVADPAQIQEGEVTKIVAAIKAANPTLGLQDSEITVDKTSGAVTVKRQGYKDETLEASKVVKQKPAEVTPAPELNPLPSSPLPSLTPQQPAVPEKAQEEQKKPEQEIVVKETPRTILKQSNPAKFVAQSRVAGETALDTMAKVVEQAFSTSETVVLATQNGFWDALSANALAGSLNAPIMLSDYNSLPQQTVEQLKRLKTKTVYICGGTHVITKHVESQLRQLGIRVVRYAGNEASDTATKIALHTKTTSDTCFVTTSWGYGDSMSVSSYAYAKHAPIFLTNMNGGIDSSALDAIRSKGFKRVVLVGGTSVISSDVEALIRSMGVQVERIAGATQYDTSLAFAKWATKDSKQPLTIGVATGYGFTDALCGSVLTGKQGGVMILADDSMKSSQTSALEQFVGSQAKNVQDLQVYGGASVVGAGVMNTLTSGFKEGVTVSESAAAGEQSQAAASSSEKAQSGSAASAATPASTKAEVRKEQ